MGRATANNGSPCVVPPSRIVLEVGFRDQETTGTAGASALDVFPLALLRIGLGGRSELILQPPTQSNRAGTALGGVFVPATGTQDVGFGVKRMLSDWPAFQESVQAFYSAPTGAPQGTAGFSAGGPTYTLTYTAAFALSGKLSLSITQNAIANAAPLDPAGAARFFSYQPAVAIGYALASNVTLFVSDQMATEPKSIGGTGNRALVAVQRVLSPDCVIDAEYEINALPAAPAARQRAFGFGAAFEF